LGNPEEASAPSDTPAMVQNSSTIARGKDRFKENVQRTTTLGATTIRHETRVSARKGVCNSYEPRDPLLNGSCGDLTNKQICELIRSPTTAGMVTAIAVPVRGNTNSDIIPYFAKNGLALTEEERSSMVKRKGICVHCGVKTHSISIFKRAPITNSGCIQGNLYSMQCNKSSSGSSAGFCGQTYL